MSKRIGYIRVSSKDQNTERQLDGVELDKVFEEKISGKDRARPQLEAMIDYAREGDIIFIHAIDRLARDATDLLNIVRELTAKDIEIRFTTERLTFVREDRDSGLSKFMLTLLAAVAEIERTRSRVRQMQGIVIAKGKGIYKGRQRALDIDDIARLKVQIKDGSIPKAALAREYGISRRALYNYMKIAS
jgi:DNA invertase Pin-like site-specific DNA recombinase